jgi:hypothetical protein
MIVFQRTTLDYVGFEVLTSVDMKSTYYLLGYSAV